MKSGYCNISEPVSEIDPARMYEIKARHSKPKQSTSSPNADAKAKAKAKHRSLTSNDDILTQNITLDTSPSQMASASTSTSSSEHKKVLPKPHLQDTSREETGTEVEPATAPTTALATGAEVPSSSPRQLKHGTSKMPRTPDTFFGGKNKKRITMKMETASQAPTEHPIVAVVDGVDKEEGGGEGGVVMQVPVTTFSTTKHTSSSFPKTKVNTGEDQSESSDLDKTFAPQLVSVNSDITDPSYGMSSSRRKKSSQQQSWRKLKKLRRYLHETINSKSTCNNSSRQRTQNPLSIIESIIDTVCTGTHPTGKPTS